ncbi:mannose-6-phosphate isomerase, class I, partial [Pseudomonas sp. BGM005]|nr:mannose-6-phosphate isomerase, class I [Pseudomonas sp. BG5]
DNHKPELIVALSERFESLSGLRPVGDTRELLGVLGERPGVSALRDRLTSGDDALRDTLGWLLSGEAQVEVDDVIRAVHDAAATESGEWASTIRAVSAIADTYPGDPGVV